MSPILFQEWRDWFPLDHFQFGFSPQWSMISGERIHPPVRSQVNNIV